MNEPLSFTSSTSALTSQPVRLTKDPQQPGLNIPSWLSQFTLSLWLLLGAMSAQAQIYTPNGVTVAGTGTAGSAANQFNSPDGMYVDGSGAIYVADGANFRIQKWAAGATSGITVAGGNGTGSAANQFNSPYDVYVDRSGAIYVADGANFRIQKWAAGATSGTTVAGGNGPGPLAFQLLYPSGVYVDGAGAIYVADRNNHRVQKFPPNSTSATSGITVAGTNKGIFNDGSAANQLDSPSGIYVDGEGAVYVADTDNHRIQKWAAGATSGITVAGGNGPGSAANQLNYPSRVYVDGAGAIYVADTENHRIQKWAAGATSGITVAGGNGAGSAANQLYYPSGIHMEGSGTSFYAYVADYGNHRIQKFSICQPVPASLSPASATLTCSASSLTLTAGGGVSYDFGAGTTPLSSPNQARVSSPGLYSVTATAANGCKGVATSNIGLNSSFVATASASSSTVLVGTVFSLSASGGTAYQWVAPSGSLLSVPPTGPVVSAGLLSSGLQTFTVVVANSPLCSQTLTTSVTAIVPADLTPTLLARPSIVYGSSAVTVVVNVLELNNQATSGPVTLKITKDAKVSFSFPPSAISVGGKTVQNSGWRFDPTTSGYYTLTSLGPIPAGGVLSVGLEGLLNPAATTGSLNISATISAGDARGVNNVDADRIEYFPQ